MHRLRYRQVHLDFHTSPAIPDVGARFDAAAFQNALKTGHVDSITCFAVCHHGWSYNETRVGKMHPHLSFDLLRAQFDAAKEIDVNVPVYITAGVNNRVAEEHPEWREIDSSGSYGGWTSSPLEPGFKTLCFNTPYLDYLCDLIAETVELFPDCDGVFLDIIHQGDCCCRRCLDRMAADGRDATNPDHRRTNADEVLTDYYRRTTDAARSRRADMPVFHNSGHITRGKREILRYFSHLEIESLPTGGWGYDHFPVSAKYCGGLGLDVLGMTGKFHTTWGEFGGYKHPNALRYECAAMLAYGSKCSVGDQLHPSGAMDETTYKLIGAAYSEVEAKEPWCVDAETVADIALVSSEACGAAASGLAGARRDNPADTGASRVMLEEHLLFDVVDGEADLDGYRLIILPDDIVVDERLAERIASAKKAGASLLLTGKSGIGSDGFLFDVGATWEGESPYQPDFVAPEGPTALDTFRSPLVMYLPSQRIRVAHGSESLGKIFDPYFNRTFDHFCSHQHAPPKPDPSPYSAGVRKESIVYLAHPVFSIYAAMGASAYRDYAARAVRALLSPTVETDLPSAGRVTLTRQVDRRRYVCHLLYATPAGRGGRVTLSPAGYVRDSIPVEVIEDLPELAEVNLSVSTPETIRRVTVEPEGTEIDFEECDGRTTVVVDRLACHGMVVFHYDA